MKIKELQKGKSNARYKLDDEYTGPYGSIIFDNSIGGNVNDSYFYRFNKNTDNKRSVEDYSPRQISCIDFYINNRTHEFQLIELVVLKDFEIFLDESISFSSMQKSFFNPVIDISTWVSLSFGGKKNFDYDNGSYYLNTEDQVNVKIIHNNKDVVQFVFGDLSQQVYLNDQISVFIDDLMNLSSIVISDTVEIPKLIQKLLK